MASTDRRQARVERLTKRAAKKRAAAEALIARNQQMGDVMMGTPVLVGHHSERRHRRDLDRMRARDTKAVELIRDAEQLERQAQSAATSTAIRSDDPDAIGALREKLAELEARQAKLRQYRKALRGPNAERQLLDLGVPQLTADEMIRCGIPAYYGTNLSARIGATKKRIAELEKAAARGPREPEVVNGVRIVEADNRVRMFFGGKPAETVRAALKRSAFRWSPTEGAWQRHASDRAWNAARAIASEAA